MDGNDVAGWGGDGNDVAMDGHDVAMDSKSSVTSYYAQSITMGGLGCYVLLEWLPIY